MLHLSETELRFLVETVATRRHDYDHIVNLVRDKDDLLEPMLEDPKLVQRLFQDQEAFVRVSPRFLFTVLLGRVRQELEKEAYILETDFRGKRVPVFEAPSVAEMLADKPTRNYLADMLASFARTNSGVVYWKEHGTWHKRRFSDIDIDDMIELARISEPEFRPALYKRIADVALFLSGIFPDHLGLFGARRRASFSVSRTLKDHERQGQRFYNLAAREIEEAPWQPILKTLAAKFTLARWALNTLSERYLKTHRVHYFRVPE